MKNKSKLPMFMIGTAVASGILTALCFALFHRLGQGWLKSAAITFLTVFYHFAMRLLVGAVIPNTFDHRSLWFRPRAFEEALYRTLMVKRWKNRMPTYDPRLFSLEENSLEQIINNICQAEVVHEVIVLLSFVPLLFSLLWDSLAVFVITSLFAALLDTSFVLLQRYNRPRLVRLLQKQLRL